MGLFSRKRNEPITAQPIGAITGAGATFKVSSYADATQLAQQRQPWQQKAYRTYDTEGHLFYATNYVGSAMARIKLVAAKRPPEDGLNQTPEIIKTGAFANAIRDISSPRGGQRGLLRQIGRNVFLAGEVWIIGSADTLPNGQVRQAWDAVSINELTTSGGSDTSFRRRRLPGTTGSALPAGSLTIRIWKEHPEFSELADSGTRSAMDLLEKIILANRAEKNLSRARISGAGILGLPQELVPPAWQNQSNNANPMKSNPLYEALADSMMGPQGDEDHPSSIMPLLLVGPAEVLKGIVYEPMTRSFDIDQMNASVNQAVEQLANTLEIPKEVLLGAGEQTRWNAWAIREDTFQAHIQPLVELTVDAMTQTYLRQSMDRMAPAQLEAALKEAGVDDPNDIIVWYDASQLVIRPDKAENAGSLHDRFVINDEALRRENGYSENDKVEEEEYARRVGLKLADAKMALTGKPTEPPAPAAPAAAAPGAKPPVPRTVNGPRGQSPQGPRAAAPKTPTERRVAPGDPKSPKR